MRDVCIQACTLLWTQESVGLPRPVPVSREHVIPSPWIPCSPLIWIAQEIVEQAQVHEYSLEKRLTIGTEITSSACRDFGIPRLEPSKLLKEHPDLELDVIRRETVEVS